MAGERDGDLKELGCVLALHIPEPHPPTPSPHAAAVYTHLGYVTTGKAPHPPTPLSHKGERGEKEVFPSSWKMGIGGICV
jgi:hypothetical protein